MIIYRASRLEALLDPLQMLMQAAPPRHLLAPHSVIAAHPGMQRWLSRELALRRGPRGIVANLRIELPSEWLDRLALARARRGSRCAASVPARRTALAHPRVPRRSRRRSRRRLPRRCRRQPRATPLPAGRTPRAHLHALPRLSPGLAARMGGRAATRRARARSLRHCGKCCIGRSTSRIAARCSRACSRRWRNAAATRSATNRCTCSASPISRRPNSTCCAPSRAIVRSCCTCPIRAASSGAACAAIAQRLRELLRDDPDAAATQVGVPRAGSSAARKLGPHGPAVHARARRQRRGDRRAPLAGPVRRAATRHAPAPPAGKHPPAETRTDRREGRLRRRRAPTARCACTPAIRACANSKCCATPCCARAATIRSSSRPTSSS